MELEARKKVIPTVEVCTTLDARRVRVFKQYLLPFVSGCAVGICCNFPRDRLMCYPTEAVLGHAGEGECQFLSSPRPASQP